MAGVFGREQPATGFALGIERVLMALERQGIETSPLPQSVYVGWAADKLAAAIAAVQQLRAAGEQVELALQSQTRQEAETACRQHGCKSCRYIA